MTSRGAHSASQRNDLRRAFDAIEKWHRLNTNHGPAVYPDGWQQAAKGNTDEGLARWRKWLDKQR